MIVASWNVNSITVRLPQVLAWLEETRPDVLCMQETKTIDDKFPVESFEEIGYSCAYFGQKTYNGVAIVSANGVEDVSRGFDDMPRPEQVRFVKARVDSVNILNAYVPNGSAVGSEKYEYKLSWLRGLREYLDKCFTSDDHVLLCGDFNVAPEDRDVFDPESTRGGILVSEGEREALEHVKDWGFTDSFRLHEMTGGHYTWWDYRQGAFRRQMGFRIDHIWVSDPLTDVCSNAWIDVEPRTLEKPSDHTPIVAEFEL